MKKHTLLMAIAFLLMSKNAIADFKILNNTADAIIVAIGYIDKGVPVSEGWFTLNPRELKTIKSAALPGMYYYYYTNSLGTAAITGNVDFYICNDKDFKITGDNITGFKSPKKIKFKQNKLLATGGNYTITIEANQIADNEKHPPQTHNLKSAPPLQHQATPPNK